MKLFRLLSERRIRLAYLALVVLCLFFASMLWRAAVSDSSNSVSSSTQVTTTSPVSTTVESVDNQSEQQATRLSRLVEVVQAFEQAFHYIEWSDSEASRTQRIQPYLCPNSLLLQQADLRLGTSNADQALRSNKLTIEAAVRPEEIISERFGEDAAYVTVVIYTRIIDQDGEEVQPQIVLPLVERIWRQNASFESGWCVAAQGETSPTPPGG